MLGQGFEQYFDFARQRAFLDFIWHVGNDFQITDEFWERLQSVVSRNNASGEFVTFLGYEWSANTPNGGDHNGYSSSMPMSSFAVRLTRVSRSRTTVGSSVYVAFTGVFVHVLQIVTRQVVIEIAESYGERRLTE